MHSLVGGDEPGTFGNAGGCLELVTRQHPDLRVGEGVDDG